MFLGNQVFSEHLARAATVKFANNEFFEDLTLRRKAQALELVVVSVQWLVSFALQTTRCY